MRILIVDDEIHIQTIIKIALESDGFVVENFGSGTEALARAKEFGPDLILLDVMMPDMSGTDLLKALRQIPQCAETPVIFMTALSQYHEVELYKSLGALDVIRKPFDPMTLSSDILGIWKGHFHE